MKTKINLLILGLGLVLSLSCTKYPPDSDRLTEDLAVITRYDTKTNFSNYKTFAIVSSIAKITEKDTTYLNDQTATAILDAISKNMTARGFTKVDVTATPDFGIQVEYYQNTNIYVYSYGGYWGYPYWYYYYPYYPTYYSSYTTGMCDIELIDLKYRNNNDHSLTLRWNAYIRGLLTGGHSTSEVLGAIDQAFSQTPALVTTAK